MVKKTSKERVNTTEQRYALDVWSGDALAELMVERGSRANPYWSLSGVASEKVSQIIPSLSRALARKSMLLLTLDPLGAHSTARTFSEVIDAYVEEVSRREGLSDKVEELIEWMHSSSRGELSAHDREVMITDTLSRLWVALNEDMPAVLVVFNPSRLASQVMHHLSYLIRYYFYDPVASLSPDSSSQFEKGHGIVAVVSEGREQLDVDPSIRPFDVDVSRHFENEVREYLTRPEVIRTLLQTTRGDMGRLEELVSEFGSDVHHLWARRVSRLEQEQQDAMRLLSAAGDMVDMNLLHAALMEREQGGSFGMHLKMLSEQGYVQRVVQMGSVRVGLADLTLGEHLMQELDAGTRQSLHEALYRAALQVSEHSESVDVYFVSRHALLAGAIDVALEYGVRAARQLFKQGALEEATDLLEELLEHAEHDVLRAELHAMSVDAWSRLGRWRKALRHCGYLKRHVAGERGRIELQLRTATLLVKLGRYETAAKLLDEGITCFEQGDVACDVGARLATERGEAAFKLGDYQEAAKSATKALEILELADKNGHMQQIALQKARLNARNLLGKVYILLAEHDKALTIFDENLSEARAQRWPGEAARAEGNIGVVAMQRFDYEEAISRLERVLAFSQHSPLVSRAICLLNLAVIHHYRFEFKQALEHTLEALRVSRQNEEDSVYSTSLGNLALLYKDMGDLNRAEQAVEALIDDRSPVRNSFISPHFRGIVAAIAYERENYGKVVKILAPFVEESKGDTVINAGLSEVFRLAMAYCEQGDMSAARQLLSCIEIPKGREEPRVEVMRTIVESRIAVCEHRFAEAEEGFTRASSLASRTGILADGIRAEFLRISLSVKQEQTSEAQYACEKLLAELTTHAEHMPESMRNQFFALPLHRKVVGLARQLKAEIPAMMKRYIGDESDSPIAEGQREHDAAWQAWRQKYSEIVGETPRLLQLFRIMDKVAASNTPVLLLGESGTGKELFAEAIHRQSDRAQGPLIKVNCAAFVESLLMSELFGHEKGAFTGAVSQKIGRFEMADGGTIFLDEIADISPQTQVALLRVLQEGEIERVGGSGVVPVDVRIVCATNKDLEQMVQEGSFRLDLYYRLKGMVLELPALRERREDIPRLAEALASKVGQYQFSRKVMERLVAYSWPGNVRELQNFVRSVLLFVDGQRVEEQHIAQFDDFFAGGSLDETEVGDIVSDWLSQREGTLDEGSLVTESEVEEVEENVSMVQCADPEQALVQQIVSEGKSLQDIKKRLEIECIRHALIETQGNVTQAARLLQMKRPRLSQIVNSSEDLSDLKDDLIS